MSATIGWRRRDEDGMIVIRDLPNGAEHAPMLSAELAKGLLQVEDKWGDLCREIGSRHQLPDGWLQSMIWRESGGKQRAFRQERNADGTPRVEAGRFLTGIGLMQITSPALKGSHSDEELYDPALNIAIGAKYISMLSSRPDTRAADGKADFAKLAAAFNAGGVRDSGRNRWGMVQTTGHVDAEVAAFNTWLHAKMDEEQKAAVLALAHQFLPLELLDDHGPAGLDEDSPDTPRNT